MAGVLGSTCFWIILSIHAMSLVLAQDGDQFVHYDFKKADLELDEMANTNDGPLHLTNNTNASTGHAFHKTPMKFTGSSYYFSTEFVFAIFPVQPPQYDQGMAFVVSPIKDLRYSYTETSGLGIFNKTNDNNTANHILAIELDTNFSPEALDKSSNHVGNDINSIVSVDSANASYFNHTEGKNISLTLASGKSILIWIDFNGIEQRLDVTLAPLPNPKPVSPLLSSSIKPNVPLLSRSINLSEIFNETMFVGFSGSTGAVKSDQYILAWSFKKGKRNIVPKGTLLEAYTKQPKVSGRITYLEQEVLENHIYLTSSLLSRNCFTGVCKGLVPEKIFFSKRHSIDSSGSRESQNQHSSFSKNEEKNAEPTQIGEGENEDSHLKSESAKSEDSEFLIQRSDRYL